MTDYILTQQELKAQLHYNSETGIFTRLIHSRNYKVGDIAGYVMNTGYNEIRVIGSRYLAHRLAWLYMTGEMPKDQIDHINKDRLDNRWCNLREASNKENNLNKSKQKNNTSGYKGVYFDKRGKVYKWYSKADIAGKTHSLGYFITAESANIAYQEFTKKHHGEFYRE